MTEGGLDRKSSASSLLGENRGNCAKRVGPNFVERWKTESGPNTWQWYVKKKDDIIMENFI